AIGIGEVDAGKHSSTKDEPVLFATDDVRPGAHNVAISVDADGSRPCGTRNVDGGEDAGVKQESVNILPARRIWIGQAVHSHDVAAAVDAERGGESRAGNPDRTDGPLAQNKSVRDSAAVEEHAADLSANIDIGGESSGGFGVIDGFEIWGGKVRGRETKT